MSSAESDWDDLARKSQQGDKAAYNALLRDVVPYIHAVIGGGLANQDWADDIVQEILISIHKSLHTYTPDRPFKPWLTSIIHFRKTDFLRKHYGRKRIKEELGEDVHYQQQTVTHSAHTLELRDMEAHFKVLSDNQRKAFVMMRVEGYTAAEVGDELGMTESAVKVSVHRATKAIQKAIKKADSATQG